MKFDPNNPPTRAQLANLAWHVLVRTAFVVLTPARTERIAEFTRWSLAEKERKP